MASDILNAAKKGNRRKLKELLAGGVAVDACDVELQTPLFMAALKGRVKCVRLLLAKNANANHETIRGTTPLHAACHHGNVKVIKALVEHGADLARVGKLGDTPRDCALRRENKSAVQMLDELAGLIQAQASNVFSLGSSSSPVLLSRSRLDSSFGSSHDRYGAVYGMMHPSGSRLGHGLANTPGACASIPEATSIHSTGRQLQLTSDTVLQLGLWMGHTVLVKRPHPAKVNGQVVRKLFSEVDVLGQLHHPNIIMLMAVCNSPCKEEVCMVLEPMKRATLYYQLHERRRKFGVGVVVMLLCGIADGLKFVHQMGYVHSYVRPDSILIGSNLQAKLCNFEYAQMAGQTSMSHVSAMFPYMAPEQLGGMPVDKAGDVYSFGCVLWECLTGEVPWADLDVVSIPDWVARKHRRLQLEKSWPVAIQRLLSCAFGAADSRPSIGEVLAKLTVIADTQSPFSRRVGDDPFAECRSESRVMNSTRSTSSFMNSANCLSAMSLDHNSLKLSDHQCVTKEQTHGSNRSHQYAVPPASEADIAVSVDTKEDRRTEGSEDDEFRPAQQPTHRGTDTKDTSSEFMDLLQLELLQRLRPKTELEGEGGCLQLPPCTTPVPYLETRL